MPTDPEKRAVEIIAGPLTGLHGTLLELMGRERAVVSVRIGERKVPVELDYNMISLAQSSVAQRKKAAKKRSRRP